jgi:hypothetical protein
MRKKNIVIGPDGPEIRTDCAGIGQQQITRLDQTGAVEHGSIGESPHYWRLLLISKYMKI